jgi:hypothetical protein
LATRFMLLHQSISDYARSGAIGQRRARSRSVAVSLP